jgi:hypothetical protein
MTQGGLERIMRHLSVKLFFFLAACIIMGCSDPVGSIDSSGGNGNGRGNTNFLLLKPNRILYAVDNALDDTFFRPSDFQVYAADGGTLKKLDPMDSDLQIEITTTLGFLGAPVSEKVDYAFPFAIPGRYVVKGTYFGNTDEYSIQVEGTLVNPGDGTEFADIIWL